MSLLTELLVGPESRESKDLELALRPRTFRELRDATSGYSVNTLLYEPCNGIAVALTQSREAQVELLAAEVSRLY